MAQGLLGGVAFWAVEIDGAIFWGTVITVLSIIPGVGSALVWVPAAIILTATGAVWRGVALDYCWCAPLSALQPAASGRGASAAS